MNRTLNAFWPVVRGKIDRKMNGYAIRQAIPSPGTR